MLDSPTFVNRTEAGEQLAKEIQLILSEQALTSGITPRPIVYALPRGGLPVAAPIARSLGCPLTVIVSKKISHPENPELAVGAVTASGDVLWVPNAESYFELNSSLRLTALNKAFSKAKSLEAQFLPACPKVNPEGATLILVDDGIATGMTIAVAAHSLRKFSPAQIWLCSPVAHSSLLPWLQLSGERLIILKTPKSFFSVSNFYINFPQIETNEALMYLKQGVGSRE